MPLITPIYAGLAALIFVALSLRVSLGRLRTKTSRGDGGDRDLAIRIRQQGNFTEYAPITLILIWLIEAQGAPAAALHAAGIALIASRLMHALGMAPNGPHKLRQWGMILCYLTILALGLATLALALT